MQFMDEQKAEQIKKQLIEKVEQSGLPEQQKQAIKQQILAMTPEQLEAFLMSQLQHAQSAQGQAQQQTEACFFCEVAKGNVPVVKIYESNSLLAFLDINPAVLGHTLLIPKQHVSDLSQVSNQLWQEMLQALQAIRHAFFALGFEGINVIFSEGLAAGQRVAHFCFHIIPRKTGDDAGFGWKKHKSEEQQLNEIGQKLAALIADYVKQVAMQQEKQQAEEQSRKRQEEAEKLKLPKRFP